jgi:DeoR/GlpR family transcriptional regulator of sugar metabolism
MKERIDKVLEILARKGYRSVAELSADLEVSEMTVRRYLDRLEEKELIKRTHGGAFAGLEMIEVDYRVRETVRRAEKEAIGRLAWSLIQPGESVFIDAGSTTAYLALAMDDTRRITVVTNSTMVLRALEDKANIETILIGGKVHAISHSLVGPIAEETVRPFRFTKAFLGTVGINLAEGLSQSNVEEVPVKKQVAQNARQVIVLADSSKINRDVLMMFLRLDQVHMVITDNGIAREHRHSLEDKGIRVLVADGNGQSLAPRGGDS